jgi:hypothetical protein
MSRITLFMTAEQREMLDVMKWLVRVNALPLLLALLPTIVLYTIGIVLVVS